MFNKLKWIVFISFISHCLVGQSFTINGYIFDKQTKEPLIGANIIDSLTQSGTSSNEYGYYSLTLPKGDRKLVVSYVGYQTFHSALIREKNLTIDFELENFQKLATIEVTASPITSPNTYLGTSKIPMEKLKDVPNLMGEQDIIRALSLTPGVSGGAEGTTGLFVRGGTPDQNLILIDGAKYIIHLICLDSYLFSILMLSNLYNFTSLIFLLNMEDGYLQF